MCQVPHGSLRCAAAVPLHVHLWWSITIGLLAVPHQGCAQCPTCGTGGGDGWVGMKAKKGLCAENGPLNCGSHSQQVSLTPPVRAQSVYKVYKANTIAHGPTKYAIFLFEAELDKANRAATGGQLVGLLGGSALTAIFGRSGEYAPKVVRTPLGCIRTMGPPCSPRCTTCGRLHHKACGSEMQRRGPGGSLGPNEVCKVSKRN